MPDLSNIQTYEKIDGSNFKQSIERYCRVLKSIELWNEDIKAEFDGFEKER